ncbi:hypothetical protein GCM10010488_28710 [Oerskovia jenensis]
MVARFVRSGAEPLRVVAGQGALRCVLVDMVVLPGAVLSTVPTGRRAALRAGRGRSWRGG